MAEEPAARINALVAEHPVVVFSKTYCGYCNRVKQLLSTIPGCEPYFLELDKDPSGHDIQAELLRMTSSMTVPSVWIGGKYIGGCDTTTEVHARGELIPAIEAAVRAKASDTDTVDKPAGVADTPDHIIRIEKLIADNNVAVFSKTYCPFCMSVKRLLNSLGAEPGVLELDELDDGPAMQAELAKRTGSRTVPSVWIGGKYVGGNDDTQALHQHGNLVPMIEAARARRAAEAETKAVKPASEDVAITETTTLPPTLTTEETATTAEETAKLESAETTTVSAPASTVES